MFVSLLNSTPSIYFNNCWSILCRRLCLFVNMYVSFSCVLVYFSLQLCIIGVTFIFTCTKMFSFGVIQENRLGTCTRGEFVTGFLFINVYVSVSCVLVYFSLELCIVGGILIFTCTKIFSFGVIQENRLGNCTREKSKFFTGFLFVNVYVSFSCVLVFFCIQLCIFSVILIFTGTKIFSFEVIPEVQLCNCTKCKSKFFTGLLSKSLLANGFSLYCGCIEKGLPKLVYEYR